MVWTHGVFPGLNKRTFNLKELFDIGRHDGIVFVADRSIGFGFAFKNGLRSIIFYNPELPPLRLRHVVGHELAHLLLGHFEAKAQGLQGTALLPPYSQKDLEHEADCISFGFIFPRLQAYSQYLRYGQICLEKIYRQIKNCDCTAAEALQFASISMRSIALGWKHLRKDCPYGRLCKRGRVCPFILRCLHV